MSGNIFYIKRAWIQLEASNLFKFKTKRLLNRYAERLREDVIPDMPEKRDLGPFEDRGPYDDPGPYRTQDPMRTQDPIRTQIALRIQSVRMHFLLLD